MNKQELLKLLEIAEENTEECLYDYLQKYGPHIMLPRHQQGADNYRAELKFIREMRVKVEGMEK